jgi:hypothetical protein
MTKATRWIVLLCFVAAIVAVAWDFTPPSAGHDKSKGDVSAPGLMQKRAGDEGAAATKTIKRMLEASS